MDTSDPDITFDSEGICNHCRSYENASQRDVVTGERGRHELERLAGIVKRRGHKRDYDCVLGLSGGVDSSYTAYVAHELGLRPLAVHLDNGWNSELAVENVHSVVNQLGIDLITHVVDWEEFRRLQLAFFRASVVDIELLTDHAITALVYRTAVNHRIHYVLSGNNFRTEAIMPRSWVHRKSDLRNLRDIAQKFGGGRPDTLPTASTLQLYWWQASRRIRTINVLDYIDYEREPAIRTLEAELGWRNYGGKHYESIFTRFYQANILPTKFHIDKRRAHLSTLINSGQTSREEALRTLEEPLYDPVALADHRAYVTKKLGITEAEFDALMHEPPRSHYDFASDDRYVKRLLGLRGRVRRLRSRT
jgi:N-acetyl sugar amidotransferase